MRDLLDGLEAEDIAVLNELKETEGYKLLQKIGSQILPRNLGLQLMEVDLTNNEDLKKIALNQTKVQAIEAYLTIVEATTPSEAIESFEEDFITPDYSPEINSGQEN